MNFVDSRDMFGNGPTKEIPMLRAAGAPSASTVGAVGCLYMDTDSGAVYKCTAASDGAYTWVALIDKAEIQAIVDAYLEANPPSSDSGQNPTDLSAILETVPDNNLLDVSAAVTSFVDSTGATVTGNFSNYIPVKYGYRYITNISGTRYDWFDADRQHISTEWDSRNPKTLIPAQDGYLLIRLPADYSGSLVLEGTDIWAYCLERKQLRQEYVRTPWRGKRWLCIGDSITTDSGVYAENGYGKLISRDLKMTLHNIAVSGKTASWGYEQLDSMADAYDLVTVMLGTNDHGYACPIGSLNDDYYTAGDYASSGSFYARMQLLVEKLQRKYPKSLILMLTPIKRTAVGETASNVTNDAAGYQINTTLKLTTEAYRDAVIAVCEYYSIPCVDLYNAIDPRTEANRELYFMSASDGTHPNDLGHALMLAPVIKDAILRHTPYVFPVWDDSGEDATTYTVTNALTNVTNSNSVASVTAGASYTATLTAAVGYVLGNASVTMGGEDITATAYAGGTITIGAVTGDVVITATATAEDSGEDDSGSTEPVLIHAYGPGVKDETIEDTAGDSDMTASGEGHGVNCNEGTWNLTRGESFSIRSKITRNTIYHRLSHHIHTGARGGIHVFSGNTPYDMTGRLFFGLGAPADSTKTYGDAVVRFYYLTAHDSTANSELIYGTKAVAKGDTVELALTWDADTSTVRLYQDGELIGEQVTTVPLAVDGLYVRGNYTTAADDSAGSSPAEYIELYRGVITPGS